MTDNIKNNNGFSLLELSVVITIMAVLLAGGISIALSKKELQRIELTRDKLEYIMKYIDKFTDEKDYLPCPADGTVSFTHDNFGLGLITDNDNPLVENPTTCSAGNIITSLTNNIVAGVVPVYTLNIPISYTIDGWNRRITYVVDQDLTYKGSNGNGGYDDNTPTTGNIEVRNTPAGTALTTEAAVLLISHGALGHGAWGGAGGTSRIQIASPSTEEIENAHFSAGTYDHQYIQAFPSANFDHIILYKTKWQLNGVE